MEKREENNNSNQKSEIALREEQILSFWNENKIFEKSLTKDAPKGNYVFYDGPPFATGLPHYGHILGSTAKDVIGRYQTMRGYSVPRRWGWDCHGLPIENIVEKDLNISGKRAIEELGIDKFVEHARSKVLTYVAEWEKTINRIGRWVDFSNSYKTMDNTFIESVWWALGELHKKDLLYEGVRVLAYCPRCETPIANSEIAMDNSYKDITDISVYVKFKLKDEANTYLLAWTTTPWTLPGNTAIAINNDINYVYVSNEGDNGKEILIIAEERFPLLKDRFKNPEIIRTIKGSELVGLSYEPVFDYYRGIDIPNKDNIWKVWHADFVTVDQGTGIAHEAPAFGEDDMNLAKEHNIPFIRHVEPNGVFSKEVTDFAGIKVKPKEDGQSTDVLIIKHLAHEGKLFAKEKIIHSYPHCYRCETPLLYYALPSWFVNIQNIKSNLMKNAESMSWVPSHLKDGRFKNIMENAPDWTISRNRYWASPLPFWKSETGKVMHITSLEDLKSKIKKSGNKYFVMRHGEAENNVKNIYSFDPNKYHLTEKGRNQVLEKIQEIKNNKITKIFSSPFLRTKETAIIIAEQLGIDIGEILYDDRIIELNFGDFSEKPMQECWDYQVKNQWQFDTQLPNGESYQDAKNRFGGFLYEIDKKYNAENILIVTHGIAQEVLPTLILGSNKEGSYKIFLDKMKAGTGSLHRQNEFVSLPHNHNYELDLHRPYIDSVVLVDEEGVEFKRIPEVIDCWFESGSMPFAQDHYPFENKNWKEKNFPSGFVAEYIAQTRTWFYYTHAISSTLFGEAPFKYVVTTGNILAEDGQKMSKSKNNFPDPWILFNKYGVDALRFYLMSCPVMKGEDINFSEKSVQDIANKIINRLGNVLTFYELYRDKSLEKKDLSVPSSNVLDKWMLSRLEELKRETTKGMEGYEIALAMKPFELFLEDLSTWYLRRSRDRLKDGDKDGKVALYYILKELAKLLAPFTPFLAENIWLKLKSDDDAESVHLVDWPQGNESIFSKIFGNDKKVIENMQKTRDFVTLGLEARQKAGIKVRQPLTSLKLKADNEKLSDEYLELIKDEVNVKDVIFDDSQEDKAILDTNITSELKEEGIYRELVRAIQDMRKKEGLTPSDEVVFSISSDSEGKDLIQKYRSEFMGTILAKDLVFEENDGVDVNIDNMDFKIVIK